MRAATAHHRLAWKRIAVSALFAGCTVSFPTPEKVTGTYRAQFTDGTELLILREGGQFEETFTFPDGRVERNHGTWKQDRPVHPRRVLLNAAIVRGYFSKAAKRDWEFIPALVSNQLVELQATPDPDGNNVLRQE